MPGEDVKQIVGLDLAGLSCIFLEQDLHLARTRVCDRARERERVWSCTQILAACQRGFAGFASSSSP